MPSNQSSWIEVPENSDFPLENIPFGICENRFGELRPATRIGDSVIDLSALCDYGYFDDLGLDDLSGFYEPYLNSLIGQGRPKMRLIRNRIQELFSVGNETVKEDTELFEILFTDASVAKMAMPVWIGNYTDFYASEQHAFNVGVMFRDPKNALLPNWKHIPVGYHGRASSIVISGAEIHRPKGQTKSDDKDYPEFGPSHQVDFELEMGFVICKENNLGQNIEVNDAEDHIFGLVIFNDLSARDIQKWEYVPLGPFLSKNFGSVISPWIVTLDALELFRTPGPQQVPEVLPYLKIAGNTHFDIHLEVEINGNLVTRSNMKHLYWSLSQMLAHHTVNGCNVRIGDLYATGTISGPDPGSYGSMLELAWKGTKPVVLSDGTERTFIKDNDTITMKAYAEKNGLRIGFGEASTKILPST